MKIYKSGDKEQSAINFLKCNSCGCEFSFSDKDISVEVVDVPYEHGIKKALNFTKESYTIKYIKCPCCNKIFKLKYVIDD